MQQKRFAFLFGANGPIAENVKPLQFAQNDIRNLKNAFSSSYCQFDQVVAEVAEKASSLLEQLELFVSKCEHPDLLVVHFSGHGYQWNGQLYLLCNTTNIESKLFISTAICITNIKMILDKCIARHKLLILDCCFAGLAQTGAWKSQEQFSGEEQLPGLASWKGSVNAILAACSAYHQTRELKSLELYQEKGAGFLSWAIARACDEQFIQVAQENALSLSNILNWLPIERNKINKSLPQEDRIPSPRMLKEHDLYRDDEIWFTPYRPNTIIDPYYFRNQAESHSQPFDYEICNKASIENLDLELFTQFLKEDRVSQQQDFHQGSSPEDQLRQFDLIEGSSPTYGALLCFGKKPLKWVSGVSTRCTSWRGYDRLQGWQDDREYQGNLVSQYEESLNFLKQFLQLNRVIKRDEIIEQWEIPLLVLREALTNALVHREYKNRPEIIHVEMFKDRIEISSPGDLPPLMKLELLGKENMHHPRHPQIARIFYLFRHIEKVGSGIQRMQQFMANDGLPLPKFNLSEAKTFRVTLSRPNELNRPSFKPSPQPSLWHTEVTNSVAENKKYLDLLIEGLRGKPRMIERLKLRGRPWRGVMEDLRGFLPVDCPNPDDFLYKAVAPVLDKVFGKDGWWTESKPSKSEVGEETTWIFVN